MFARTKSKVIAEALEQSFNQRLAVVGLLFAILLVHVIEPTWGLAFPSLLVGIPVFIYLMVRSNSLKNFKLRLDVLTSIATRARDHARGTSSERWELAAHHEDLRPFLSEMAQNLSRDLDLAGPHSVVASFDETFSKQGTQRLLVRCLEPSLDLGVVLRNQSEVKILSKVPGLARKFLVLGQAFVNESSQLGQLDERLKSPIYNAKLFWVPGALVLLWLVCVIAALTLSSDSEHMKWSLAFPVVSVLSLALLNKGFHELVGLSSALSALIPVVRVLEQLQQKLQHSHQETYTWIKSVGGLNRALSFLSVNSHPLVVILLNLVLPWNWVASYFAERSRARIQQQTGPLISALHDMEALASLGLFSRRKGSLFPKIDMADVLEFQELHHPCQDPKTFVANSFSFPTEKSVILITGSNMSGKSTFLRTLGVAQMLALAGAAVPCRAFRTGLFQPLTCLRVSDSLRDGASYFFAEVKRLKWILDQLQEGTLSLVLIDEIFRGTNNRERLIGSQSYVRALLKQHARSFVTTHDLELTSIEKDEPGLSNMHFSDKVSQGTMTFDYRIQPGPSPTTNALKIMNMVGLPVQVPT